MVEDTERSPSMSSNDLEVADGSVIGPAQGAQEQEKKIDTSPHLGEKDTEEFPEGGRGWLVLVGTFLVLNTTYGMVNAFGVYQLYYEQHFPNTGSSVISLIGSIQPTLIYLTCVPVVFMINLIGVQWSLLVGGLVQVFAMMMISICKEIWQFYLAQGVLFGMGAGVTFFAAMSVPQEWFKKRRALAVGITASGSSLGGVIWPIAFQRLVAEVGFPWANRIIGFIYLPVLVFASWAVKPRLPKTKATSMWGLLPRPAVLRDLRFVTLCVANGIGMFGLFPPLFYISTFAEKLKVNPGVSQYILAVLNALSIVGRLVPPYLADSTGRLNMLVPCVLMCGVFLFAFWFPAKSEAMLLLTAIIWGAASGTYIALFPSAIGQLFGVQDLRSRMAWFFLFSAPGCLAGPSIAGTFIDETSPGIHGFNKIAAFSGAMFLGSAVVMIGLRLSYSTKLRVFL